MPMPQNAFRGFGPRLGVQERRHVAAEWALQHDLRIRKTLPTPHGHSTSVTATRANVSATRHCRYPRKLE
ncbi:hypothetical protein WG66_009181 [Moniliophthora roreri]|nr:hypothetical protein WG66_009181 [Moniliophthora roreri]